MIYKIRYVFIVIFFSVVFVAGCVPINPQTRSEDAESLSSNLERTPFSTVSNTPEQTKTNEPGTLPTENVLGEKTPPPTCTPEIRNLEIPSKIHSREMMWEKSNDQLILYYTVDGIQWVQYLVDDMKLETISGHPETEILHPDFRYLLTNEFVIYAISTNEEWVVWGEDYFLQATPTPSPYLVAPHDYHSLIYLGKNDTGEVRVLTQVFGKLSKLIWFPDDSKILIQNDWQSPYETFIFLFDIHHEELIDFVSKEEYTMHESGEFSSISPSGKFVVYDGTPNIIKNIETSEVELEFSLYKKDILWLNDSKWLALVPLDNGYQVIEYDLLTSGQNLIIENQLLEVDTIYEAVFSPDGQWLAYVDDYNTYSVKLINLCTFKNEH